MREKQKKERDAERGEGENVKRREEWRNKKERRRRKKREKKGKKGEREKQARLELKHIT